MADLYGIPKTPPSSSNQEDISFSSFFQALHNSSATTSSSPPCMTQFIYSPENMAATAPLEDGQGFGGSRGASQVGSSTGVNVNFSDPGGVFFEENLENAFFSVLESDSNASCNSDGPEASEVPSSPPRPRSSSKRGRAAEVHNLSEKRRRSRINEKMKALQSLIPNSNKTDKASMLDEAIEYLKQLQLQVQMLTLRNGLGLPPMCLSGEMQPLQLGRVAEDTLVNRGTGIVHARQEGSLQTFYGLPNLCTPPSQPPGGTSLPDLQNAETSYGFELPVQAQFEQLNPPNLSKDICRENLSLQMQVDTDQCSNSWSGVS